MTEEPVKRTESLPTGAGTAAHNDVADPHPDFHEPTDEQPNPGGIIPHRGPDIGPNSYAHDGTAPPKPDYRRPTDDSPID
ncbi:MAG: hypothetical protein ACOH2L_06240 [Devosia sp.]